MRKIILSLVTVLLLGLISLTPASASHLSSYDVCAINLPHPGSDYVVDHYWVYSDTDRCIGAHGYGSNRVLHYFIVCEPGYLVGWHWKPGLSAWLNAECP